MSQNVYENMYASKKDFAKVLPQRIINALENNDINIEYIYVKRYSGSENIVIDLSYCKFNFKINYESPGLGFMMWFLTYIDELKFNIDNEEYKVNSAFDKELYETLRNVVDEINAK